MNEPSRVKVGLLLSDAINTRMGTRLDRIAVSAGLSLKRYTVPSADEDVEEILEKIHVAFFSRDLYEGSTLHAPGPLSDAFFRVADAAPNLEWLHVCSSGLDLPQYGNILQRKVLVTGSAGVTSRAIAQTALAAIVALGRGFGHWLPAQARRQWSPLTGLQRPQEIHKQRVIIVGAGAIGRELGRLLKAVGFQVTAVRREPVLVSPFDDVIALSQLDKSLKDCDWLVLAVPLTQETRNLIDERRLSLLPRTAYVVNVARGELIDEEALVRALTGAKLAGAYLDAFVKEPLPSDSPLWGLPNVWLTPHNSAANQGHEERVLESFVMKFKEWTTAQADTRVL